jgi:hypothetical protein
MIITYFVESANPNTNIQSVKEEIMNIPNMSKFIDMPLVIILLSSLVLNIARMMASS